jgi:hypothetical protein
MGIAITFLPDLQDGKARDGTGGHTAPGGRVTIPPLSSDALTGERRSAVLAEHCGAPA